MNQRTAASLLTRQDYPDPDVIRVDDTYYMVSTTMHFMPGCVILRSYDLLNWEIASYVYETLDDTPAQRMEGNQNIYGQGMWAATIRHHNGRFYICFVANDTKKTYLYQSEAVTGPWKKQIIDGFYHDCSLLFDEERVFLVYGNTEIHLTELTADLTGPRPGGLDRVIVSDAGNPNLGYEGSHIYRINGRYYVFFIHSSRTEWRRIEACFCSDSLEGEFYGKDVLVDDMGYHNQGVAQGGIVDTPDGRWYGVLFQDRGAIGRIPVLVPVRWEDDFPVFGINGRVPEECTVTSTNPGYRYRPLFTSDDFHYTSDADGRVSLKLPWQWNHIPDDRLWTVDGTAGRLDITTGKLCANLCQAVNTLTQRMTFPSCSAQVTIDGTRLKAGDFAGICALQGCYGMIALTRTDDGYDLVMMGRPAEDASLCAMEADIRPGVEYARIAWNRPAVSLRVTANFQDMKDEAFFFYLDGGKWNRFGIPQKLFFKMDHFCGCRVGLFCYSTASTGGTAGFLDFCYHCARS